MILIVVNFMNVEHRIVLLYFTQLQFKVSKNTLIYHFAAVFRDDHYVVIASVNSMG